MKFTKTDYGYSFQDTKFYVDDEYFGVEPGNALEWARGFIDAIAYMTKKFEVDIHWGWVTPAWSTLVYLANRVGFDENIAAIGYHVQVVSPNTSFVKIMIYKDGNPSPLQIVFYNEDKMMGIISPIPLPQYFNKQTHRRKRAKKIPFTLRKFPHTELLETSLFMEKAVHSFVDFDAIPTWAYLNDEHDINAWLEK